jgi:hypothetical protein
LNSQRDKAQARVAWQRRAAVLVTLLVGFLVALPGLGSSLKDSYPLSTYPMFAKARGTPLVHQLVGVDGEARRFPVPPELLGTSEVLQAKALIKQAVKRGRTARRKLCEQVSARARDSGDYPNWVAVELIAARYDAIAYLTQAPRPVSSRRLQRCGVRSASGE